MLDTPLVLAQTRTFSPKYQGSEQSSRPAVKYKTPPSQKNRPTAFVRILTFKKLGTDRFRALNNSRKQRLAGIARGFHKLRKHRPTDPRFFIAEVFLYLRKRRPPGPYSMPRGR